MNIKRNYGSEIMRQILTKEKLIIFLWCILAAFCVLSICSRSSFLYPCNNWDDANSYFSMGKGMMNGLVIYRDLYDQKGPYLYLLYGIAYLLSNTDFLGVFFLEIISAAFFLYSGFKTICLFADKRAAWFLVPILAAASFISKSFYWGGAAEEFCLPMFGWSIYYLLNYLKNEYPQAPKRKDLIAVAVFAGITMQIKYTMLGFYFAWMLIVVIALLINKRWKEFFTDCCLFLAVMAATAVPWIIYFGIHGALDDWFLAYVYNNLFLYSDLAKGSVGLYDKIYTLAKILYWLILDNLSYFVFIGIGVAGALFRKNHVLEKAALILLAGFLFVGIFVGGAQLPYYSIPFIALAIPGYCYVGMLLTVLLKKVVIRGQAIWGGVLPILLCVIIGYTGSMNVSFMDQSREDFYLYHFKEEVEKEDNPTLLNVGCLDAGLYTISDIVPTCKFFQTNGIPYPFMFEEQKRYIKEGKTMFVLARDGYPERIGDHYELILEEDYSWGIQSFTYYLFKRK